MLGTFSGGGLGFGVAFTLYDDFSRTAEQIRRSMGDLNAYTDELQRKMDVSMNQMALGAGMVAAGLAVIVPMGYGVKIAGEFEAAKLGLETFLGSAEAAQKVFEGIQEDAARTPFGVKGLLSANRMLISTGMGADKARQDIINLTNAIAAVGGGNVELERMAFNMVQIKNQGKAMGIDVRQFATAGIDIWGVLAASTGKNIAQLKEMDITYEMLTEAFRKANEEGGKYFGASERLEKSLLGTWEKLTDNVQFAAASIGDQLLPLAHDLLDWAINITQAIRAFVGTPLGGWVTRVTFALSALLVVTGTLLLTVNLLRVSVYRMAGAFGDQTKAMILTTIAQKGVIAGFRQMAAAAWASLGPYVLIVVAIVAVVAALKTMSNLLSSTDKRWQALGAMMMFALGPIGWVVGLITLINKGLKDFDALLDGSGKKLSGMAGFFQKIGGVIRGAIAIWKSWNNETETFELTETMEKALDALGIRQAVLNLGTWLVRLQHIFYGVMEGIEWGVDIIYGWITSFLDWVSEAGSFFDALGININKNTTELEKWRLVGEAIGIAMVAMLGVLALNFAVMGVAALVALSPVLLALYGMYKVITMIQGAISAVKSGWDWVMGTPTVNTTQTQLPSTPTPIIDPFEARRDPLDWRSQTNPIGTWNQQGAFPAQSGKQEAENKANFASGGGNTKTITEKVTEVKNVAVQLDLDGETVASKVIDIMSLEDGRKN